MVGGGLAVAFLFEKRRYYLQSREKKTKYGPLAAGVADGTNPTKRVYTTNTL
jgi:hypothetical protein